MTESGCLLSEPFMPALAFSSCPALSSLMHTPPYKFIEQAIRTQEQVSSLTLERVGGFSENTFFSALAHNFLAKLLLSGNIFPQSC
jgi:hypothetical protein